RVYVTDVTIGEVRRAITTSIHDAVGLLKTKQTRRILGVLAQAQTMNLAGVMAKLDEPALVQELNGLFDSLLTKLEAVTISTDDPPTAELRRRFLEALPPFSPRAAKKHEFPDALTIMAAERCADRLSTPLYIVSADTGVTEAARTAARLEHIGSLQAMIS